MFEVIGGRCLGLNWPSHAVPIYTIVIPRPCVLSHCHIFQCVFTLFGALVLSSLYRSNMVLLLERIKKFALSAFSQSLQTSTRNPPPIYPAEDDFVRLHGAGPTPAPLQLTDNHMHTRDLVGRDSCSDAFGPNVSNAICAPSSTLCCTRPQVLSS